MASSPHIAIVVLSMMDDEDSVFAAMRAGARGYLVKGARRQDLLRAIEAAGSGEVIFGPGIADRMMDVLPWPAAARRGGGVHLADRPRADGVAAPRRGVSTTARSRRPFSACR